MQLLATPVEPAYADDADPRDRTDRT